MQDQSSHRSAHFPRTCENDQGALCLRAERPDHVLLIIEIDPERDHVLELVASQNVLDDRLLSPAGQGHHDAAISIRIGLPSFWAASNADCVKGVEAPARAGEATRMAALSDI